MFNSKVQTVLSQLPSQEQLFLKALQDNHIEYKEKSIFSQFFHGLSFYDDQTMIKDFNQFYKSYYLKNPQDYDPKEVKIMISSEVLFSYRDYNTNHLILSHGCYYYLDDESTISQLGESLFEFPLVLFNPLNEKPRHPLNFDIYRDFCRLFGFDFDLNDYRWNGEGQLPF